MDEVFDKGRIAYRVSYMTSVELAEL